jgi:hypothetical protein
MGVRSVGVHDALGIYTHDVHRRWGSVFWRSWARVSCVASRYGLTPSASSSSPLSGVASDAGVAAKGGAAQAALRMAAPRVAAPSEAAPGEAAR